MVLDVRDKVGAWASPFGRQHQTRERQYHAWYGTRRARDLTKSPTPTCCSCAPGHRVQHMEGMEGMGAHGALQSFAHHPVAVSFAPNTLEAGRKLTAHCSV